MQNSADLRSGGAIDKVMVVACMLLILCNVYLHVNQYNLNQEYNQLFMLQDRMSAECKVSYPDGWDEISGHQLVYKQDGDKKSVVDVKHFNHRTGRSVESTVGENNAGNDTNETPENSHLDISMAEGTDDVINTNTSSVNDHKKKKKKGKEVHVAAAHFTLDNRTHQQAYQGDDIRVTRQGYEYEVFGTITKNGYIIKGRIVRGWQAPNWTDDKLLVYNECTGKVTICRAGTYLIYGQMMFYDKNPNAAFGIHINDDVMAFVETKQFDENVFPTPDPAVVYGTSTDNSGTKRQEGRLNSGASGEHYMYMRRNTIAVIQLKKNDKVFIKTRDTDMTITTVPYLTFWGIAKLNQGK